MPPEPSPLAPLLSVLRDMAAWFGEQGVRGVVVGGVAASVLGRPRVTRDVDAVVLLDEGKWGAFLAAGSRHGFVPRLSDCLAFARRSRMLLVRHEPSGIDADVAFGALPFEEEAVANRTWVEAGGVRFPVPTPEDLIIMKAVAHRPRDLGDIEGVLSAHPGLDRSRVLRWVGQFAAAIEAPEILDELVRLFERRDKAGS